jgi:uncharacterized protein (DUF2342 family)
MPADKTWQTLDISRRNLFRGALVVAGGAAVLGAGLGATTAAAQGKIAQKVVNYQTTPKLGAKCDGCLQWVAPNACKVVAGEISPSGWCTIYAPKHK